MPTVRDAEGKSYQRIPFIDLDVVERKKKVERQPTWAERAHVEPCWSLMGFDEFASFMREAGRR